ncbi:Ig-like domain-containing domain [Virgibacillus salexigens]|uniref:SbsA Ig-like domain-containing protein n=1 Tax=Virgibacillus massiliensis TaxID=1462526 RepID=A0A024QH29_9BACI|nr:Ig-like domain-containing protein [Virgibacillus massiliensis]CDQ41819.1 hypothetical protein BN990_04196 [Virgibacillus massiliensis]
MNFVSRTFPYHLSDNVSLDQQIDIFFFLDINKKRLTSEKIILFNSTEEVSEGIEFKYNNKRLTIKPLQNMKPNSHYQVQLLGGTNGIEDITGIKLAETYICEFYTNQTEKINPPILTAPSDLVEISDDITFNWKPSIDAAYYELEISNTTNFQNLIWPNSTTPIYETSVTPHINYNKGRYYARIRSVDADGRKSHYSPTIRYYYNGQKQVTEKITKDNQGVKLSTKSKLVSKSSAIEALQQHFAFETKNASIDNLEIINSTPANDSRNIQEIEDIIVEFNQSIDPNTVSSKSIYVIEEKN